MPASVDTCQHWVFCVFWSLNLSVKKWHFISIASNHVFVGHLFFNETGFPVAYKILLFYLSCARKIFFPSCHLLFNTVNYFFLEHKNLKSYRSTRSVFSFDVLAFLCMFIKAVPKKRDFLFLVPLWFFTSRFLIHVGFFLGGDTWYWSCFFSPPVLASSLSSLYQTVHSLSHFSDATHINC